MRANAVATFDQQGRDQTTSLQAVFALNNAVAYCPLRRGLMPVIRATNTLRIAADAQARDRDERLADVFRPVDRFREADGSISDLVLRSSAERSEAECLEGWQRAWALSVAILRDASLARCPQDDGR
jgi:hypothetical protein